MRRRRSPARVGSHASATTWSSTASTRFMSRASSRAVRSRASRARSHSCRSAISCCSCYRRGMVNLVAAGVDLRIPAGEYHVATPEDVAYADLAALCAEALAHGGCVGQLDPMIEGYEPTLGPTSFVLGYRDDRGDQVWEGDGWTIRRHPFAAAADGRAWPWRGSGSFGPYSLTVHLEWTSDEIERFLTAATPLPYTRTAPERYELADVGRLVVDTGILRFLRAAGRGQAEDHVESFDRGLLLALARGALGPLHWVAFEHDWEAPFAIGDDGASLAA